MDLKRIRRVKEIPAAVVRFRSPRLRLPTIATGDGSYRITILEGSLPLLSGDDQYGCNPTGGSSDGSDSAVESQGNHVQFDLTNPDGWGLSR